MIPLLALGLAACEPRTELAPCTPDEGDLLVIATTDFTAGAVATLGTGALDDPVAPAGGDPVVVALPDGRVALLERGGGDHLRIYTPGCWEAPGLEVALEDANPHDAVLRDGLLWLTLYERAELWALDPIDGQRVLTVGLAGEADADGLPEADRLVLHDDRLFVGLERLDRDSGWTDAGGRVVEVGVDGVIASHTVGASPKIFASSRGLVALTGLYHVDDGAMGLLDPDTGEVVDVLTEADLGFDFTRYAEVGDIGVLSGVDFDGRSRVVCYDWRDGSYVEGPSDPGWYVDLAATDEVVWVAVRRGFDLSATEHGVAALDPGSCALAEVAPTLLEPYSLAVRTENGAGG